MVTPGLSVVIPTRDRADALKACLASLEAQTLPREAFEVIVVDNGSRDGTAAVAQGFAARLPLRLLNAPEPGLHVGRHAGWRAARSGVLVFADDDIVAAPGWLAAVAAQFGADERLALLGGNNLPAFEHAPPPWLRHAWERPVELAGRRGRALPALSVLDLGAGVFELDPGWVWGCNFSVRAEVLRAAGGFHPDGVPAEQLARRGDGETHVADIVRARGWTCRFDGAATVHHAVTAARMTPAYFERRAFAQGVSDSYTRARRQGGADAAPARMRAVLRGWRDAHAARQAAADAAHHPDDAARQWQAVAAAMQREHGRGQAFHQRALRADAALRDWVRKPDYL
jgi:hypothetical protein